MSKEVNVQNFEDLVLKSEKPVMVKFTALWCFPCKTMEPMLEEISEEYKGRAEIFSCDVDENHQLAEKYGIRNIPTVLYFKNGKTVDKQIGSGIKRTFINKLQILLS